MARKKEYIEEEVIEKAMQVFWKNGYETTSMYMLEQAMGINKFSIYSSFGSKNGLFLESLKCYKKKLNTLIVILKSSTKGIEGLKAYFKDFIVFSKVNDSGRGCLITNTANEVGEDTDQEIKTVLESYTNEVRTVFKSVLAQDTSKNEFTLEAQADYLLISMIGLSSASKLFNSTQLEHYIEHVFKNV
ncbi:transcriptional regulator, TetR family [Formosa agariphila KMM 3901]|uniref:Transcriptional regulator, TetR family n=1 Tax=Formosa agariphila (strain DSM 15362 / KCTC 12365 / LMG 23005 / KMM 3901 / M-2Alg 35-1) TaxID=1347342 RepID=T2KKJ2_FORAG|nr:TetR/AcrR family transcriptional regulator [Formosa agariphila]CDF79402.1 transcriptional regulator, TetR family [Formosa agariphila KMM 3901]